LADWGFFRAKIWFFFLSIPKKLMVGGGRSVKQKPINRTLTRTWQQPAKAFNVSVSTFPREKERELKSEREIEGARERERKGERDSFFKKWVLRCCLGSDKLGPDKLRTKPDWKWITCYFLNNIGGFCIQYMRLNIIFLIKYYVFLK
jgi:hypothetical protein